MDFADGGRDLAQNAENVMGAIYLGLRYRTNKNRGLDVAGFSMGGVIARYALAKYEANYVHEVDRFVSLDAPQQDAVFDPQFQDYIEYWLSPSEWPVTLTSMAGKQLLRYNTFDNSSPSEHTQFYNELRALNGGLGYAEETENIGVSFGTPTPNPYSGDEWLEVEINLWTNEHFYVNGSVAEPGSFLPDALTRMWGKMWAVVVWDLDRKTDPTFIPYESAIDLQSNGDSPFDEPFIHPNTPSGHDVIPASVIDDLLHRLGYEVPPPTSASITGPNSLDLGEEGIFHASTPDPTKGYTYNWQYRIYFDGCGPIIPQGSTALGGGASTQDVPCGQWHDGGTGKIFIYRTATPKRLELKVKAIDNEGSVWSQIKRVYIDDNTNSLAASRSQLPESFNGQGVADQLSKSATTVPHFFNLEQNYPNPFGAGDALYTTIEFSLPQSSQVQISIYDVLGREITQLIDQRFGAGTHSIKLSGEDLPAGIYIYKMQAGDFISTRHMSMLK